MHTVLGKAGHRTPETVLTLLVLNLALHIVDGVRGLHLQSDLQIRGLGHQIEVNQARCKRFR